MTVIDVKWTPFVNIIKVKCECSEIFEWQTNISLLECPYCHKMEWWHEDGFSDDYKTAKIKLT